jgi:rhodanese-related sulfurtransferase
LEINDKLKREDDFVFLDVRSSHEWESRRIETPQVRLIPLNELRKSLDMLPKETEIVTFCQTSRRAYQAQRILDSAGFKNVKFMDGSIDAWPYEISSNEPRADG